MMWFFVHHYKWMLSSNAAGVSYNFPFLDPCNRNDLLTKVKSLNDFTIPRSRMNTTLEALLAQREELDRQIAELRAIERTTAITDVLALVDRHTLTKDELFGASGPKIRKAAKSTTLAKYRDPLSSETWDGIGIPPVFMRGRDKKDFRI